MIREAHAQGGWTAAPFDTWWTEQSATFDTGITTTSGPFVASSVGSDTCVDGTWEPTRLDVPDGRTGPTAVWTGAEMIVWGGNGSNSLLLNDGGRFFTIPPSMPGRPRRPEPARRRRAMATLPSGRGRR